jgi:hypothetical protein
MCGHEEALLALVEDSEGAAWGRHMRNARETIVATEEKSDKEIYNYEHTREVLDEKQGE